MTDQAPATDPRGETTTRSAANVGAGTNVPDATNAPDVVVVRIPGPLRPLTDGAAEVTLSAGSLSNGSVGAAMEALVARYPGLRRHLLDDDGSLRGYVNIFVGDDDVRYLNGVATEVDPGAVVTIVPSIAGG